MSCYVTAENRRNEKQAVTVGLILRVCAPLSHSDRTSSWTDLACMRPLYLIQTEQALKFSCSIESCYIALKLG
jgi:hypothetical protein